MPRGAHTLHGKWVFKTKRDAEGVIKRLKARLVECGNEQIFEINFSVTLAAVIDMSSVELILVLARKWGVPAKHGDVPNAYVKADKEADLDLYMQKHSQKQFSRDGRERSDEEGAGLRERRRACPGAEKSPIWVKLGW